MDLDVAPLFPPRLLGAALAKVWGVDGQQLVPTMDSSGAEACCPITLQTMHDPTLLADGYVYERDAISRWLRGHSRAPCTNVSLPHKHLLRLAPLAEAVQVFLTLQSGPHKDVSLPARLHRAATAAEAALTRGQQPRASDGSEQDGSLESGPSTEHALLEALEMCITEGDAEVLQYQASLSRARRVVKEIHHELAARRFEANVQDLLASSRWAQRRADSAAVKQASAEGEKEAIVAATMEASRHEAAASIQLAWRLARRWRTRRAMRQRLQQSRLHCKRYLRRVSTVRHKFGPAAQGLQRTTCRAVMTPSQQWVGLSEPPRALERNSDEVSEDWEADAPPLPLTASQSPAVEPHILSLHGLRTVMDAASRQGFWLR